MKRTITILTLAATAASAFVASASAHVTAQPPEQPSGSYTLVTFRVPNEKDVPTTKLEVQFPAGVTYAATQPVPGWTAKVTMEELDTPLDDGHGGQVTEQVSTITWTGGEVGAGEFQQFPVSLKMVEDGEIGDKVFFPALQTYSDGETVEWTQKPASADDDAELENPAPSVTLVSGDDHHATASSDSGDDEAGSDADASSSSSDSDEDSGVDPNLAFGLAVAALALSLIALLRSGRGRRG